MKGSKEEQEANLFAMLLLMPHAFVKEDFKGEIDISQGNFVSELAKKYQVSENLVLMRYRYWIEYQH